MELFTWVNAVGFAAIALLAAWLLGQVNPRRPWDAAIFALSPTLALTGLINWDLLAVGLVAGALWAWSRDRPVLTGVLIGLGAATKLYPLFLLGGLLIICLRRRRHPTWPDDGVGDRGLAGRERAGVPHRRGAVEGLLETSTPTGDPTWVRSGS